MVPEEAPGPSDSGGDFHNWMSENKFSPFGKGVKWHFGGALNNDDLIADHSRRMVGRIVKEAGFRIELFAE